MSKFQKAVQDENQNFFRLKIDQENYDFSLYENDIRARNFSEIRTTPSGKFEEKRKKSKTFGGFLQNEKWVRLTITDDFIYGVFEVDSGFIVIDQLRFVLENHDLDPNYLLIYKTSDLPVNDQLVCGTVSDEEESPTMSTSNIASSTMYSGCIVLEVATDADYEYFQKHGSDSNNRILGEFNNIQGIYYSTFNLDVKVVYQHVWETSSDPYSSYTADGIESEIKNTWNQNFSQVNRDVVHLFTGKYFNTLLGSAYDIGTLCNRSNSLSFTVDRDYAFLTLAHEIGHNLGGLHSDAYDCADTSASLMCQGFKAYPMYFSSSSINRIRNYLNSSSDCLYEITGDEVICPNGSKSYTLEETYLDGDIFWEVSNPSFASIISGQGTPSVTIQNSTPHTKELNLTANVSNYGSSCVQTYTKRIHLGKPIAVLPSPGTLCTEYFPMDQYLLPASSGAVSYRLVSSSPYLEINGASEYSFDSAPAHIIFIATNPGTYMVELFTENDCGISRAAIHVTAENCQIGPGEPGEFNTYVVYPNLASDLITIEGVVESSNLEDENFTPIAELRDFGGTLLRTIDLQRKGKKNLSVSSLKNGHYFILIYKGQEREVHRVVVFK